MARKIAISGSRNYPASRSRLVSQCITTEYRRYNGDVLFLVGDCPTGADFIAKSFLDEKDWPYKEFKAEWDRYGKAAGPRRNIEMIDYGAEELIAFPDSDSRGTKQCAEYASSLNIPVYFPELESWHIWAGPMASTRD